MKQVVWLLLFANIAIFIYFQASASKPKVTLLDNQPVQPEKLKILSEKEIALLPLKASESITPKPKPTTDMQTACYEWGSISATRLSSAKNSLTQLAPDVRFIEKPLQKLAFYWIYIPKQESMAAARRKIDELKALGVKESFVIQDAEYKNAISLGVFHEESSADKFLEKLKSKGVASAAKGARYKNGDQVNLLIRNIKNLQAAEIEKLTPNFPNSKLRQVACQ
jgi:hypothetical protein